MEIPVPFATVEDLEARWRTLSAAEKSQAAVLLEDASHLVLDVCSSAATVDDDEQERREATLKRIVCNMVKRAMIAAGGSLSGIETLQQGAGPFQIQATLSNPTGDLYLTKPERAALPCGKQVAFTAPMLPVDGD